MFNENPQVKACHAGLECGILGKHLPGVDMISFAQTLEPHIHQRKSTNFVGSKILEILLGDTKANTRTIELI